MNPNQLNQFHRMQDYANFSPVRTNTTPDYSTSSESLYSSAAAAAAAAAGHMYSSSLDLSAAQSAAAMSDLMSRQYGSYGNTINEHLLSVTSRAAAAAAVTADDERLARATSSRYDSASPPPSPYHGYSGSGVGSSSSGGGMYNRFQSGSQTMGPSQTRSHNGSAGYASYPYF